ncbi:MAG: AmmeMemoRadiSam system protein B [Candidatus Binataceae bacterium]|nr:AmmeMemoRadiSam system protein B [Candidatus Binataceae bacterium]
MVEKPRIRAVEAFPLEHNGQQLICLRDPGGTAPEPIMVGAGAYFLITRFDGAHDIAALQAAFARQFGEQVTAAQVRELITALDQGYFLESRRYAARVREIRAQFAASPERPAAHAGLCYADQPEKLRAEMDRFFIKAGCALESIKVRNGKPLAGLVAPHIDPPRGGLAYAHAYAELAAHERPELVIILGTSHYGAGPELFTATRKDYATPLGAVTTDREFVDRLARRYREGKLFGDELLHRNEHSIEFQALFLAHTIGVQNYQVVPVLVSSFHQMVLSGKSPALDRRVGDFLEALTALIAGERRRVAIIAGVDFAHIGRKFGDDFGVDSRKRKELHAADHRLIGHLEGGDAEGFFGEIAHERDRWRVCGVAPLYTQLALLKGHRGRLLNYDVAMEPATESAVSFASLAIE